MEGMKCKHNCQLANILTHISTLSRIFRGSKWGMEYVIKTNGMRCSPKPIWEFRVVMGAHPAMTWPKTIWTHTYGL